MRLRILVVRPMRARAEPPDRRALVRVHGLDLEVLADELVVVLRVCDCRLEQLDPVSRSRARRMGQDRLRILRSCRGCGRRPGGPCGPRSGRTWPGRGRPESGVISARVALVCASPGAGASSASLAEPLTARPRRRRRSAPAPRLRLRRRRASASSVFVGASSRRLPLRGARPRPRPRPPPRLRRPGPPSASAV